MNKEIFKGKYERFLTGCDAIELEGGWDRETYGEMETFYTGDLVSVMLRLIVTDGSVSQREADVLNDAQKAYAAIDAWACLKIYDRIEELKASGDYEVIPALVEEEVNLILLFLMITLRAPI